MAFASAGRLSWGVLPRLPSLLAIVSAALSLGAPARAGELTVRFLDVGQGDAMLVISPIGKAVLVDAGPPESSERLARRVAELVHGPLDLAILTHPHADHLGGMKECIEAVGARLFLDPGFDHGSPLYESLLRALEAKQIPVKIAKAGRTVDLGGGASLRLLGPVDPPLAKTRSDVNANCAAARLTYGKTAFYLACDSELETERRILASGEELRSDVYKVAHHGGRHSSSAALLTRVQPTVAVISVGEGNSYGHPSAQAIERLSAYGAKVYRTDRDGEITAVSDGEAIRVSASGPSGEEPAAKKAGRGKSRRSHASRGDRRAPGGAFAEGGGP